MKTEMSNDRSKKLNETKTHIEKCLKLWNENKNQQLAKIDLTLIRKICTGRLFYLWVFFLRIVWFSFLCNFVCLVFVSFRLKRKLVSWVKAQRTLSYKRCYDRGTVHQSGFGDKSDEICTQRTTRLGLIDSRLTLRLNWIAWSANCVYEWSRVLRQSDNTMTETSTTTTAAAGIRDIGHINYAHHCTIEMTIQATVIVVNLLWL